MKFLTDPTFDIETGRLIGHSGEEEYYGPIVSFKGGTDQAQQNINTANRLENQFATEGEAEQQQILPFLTQEMNNPQGFGTQGTNELLTSGGQATSGANANAVEQANLRASRTGNPSTSGSIIDAATRDSMKSQSNNALGVNEANTQEKLAQEQAGEQGIAALSSGNIGEALSSLGLSNQAISEYITAANNTNPLKELTGVLGAVGELGTGVGAAAKGILGGGGPSNS